MLTWKSVHINGGISEPADQPFDHASPPDELSALRAENRRLLAALHDPEVDRDHLLRALGIAEVPL